VREIESDLSIYTEVVDQAGKLHNQERLIMKTWKINKEKTSQIYRKFP